MGYPLTICSTQTHNVKIFGPGGLKRFFSTSQYFCRSHNFKLPWDPWAKPYQKKIYYEVFTPKLVYRFKH